MSKQRMEEHMQRKSVEIKQKNKQLEQRVKEFNERKNMAEANKVEEMERKQLLVNRKLKHIFKSITEEWQERRESNKEKQMKGFNKKRLEDRITQ